MGILTDTDLLAIISEARVDDAALVVRPFKEESLTPVGYDLRVGNRYVLSDRVGPRTLRRGQEILIRPGTTALVETLEYVEMPRNRLLSGLIASKVSQVSAGFSHVSTTIDADWEGHLLIAIHNHSRSKLRLSHGEAFCTVVFASNSRPATRRGGHPPDRIDVLLRDFTQKTARITRRRLVTALLPPFIVVALAGIGYGLFGNNIGFSAMVVAGVALSQYLAERLR